MNQILNYGKRDDVNTSISEEAKVVVPQENKVVEKEKRIQQNAIKQEAKYIKEPVVEYQDNSSIDFGSGVRDNYSVGQNSERSKMIVKIFALLLIIFAIFLSGYALVTMDKNNKQKIKQQIEQSKITAEIIDEGKKVKIVVKSQNNIEKVIYSWDGKIGEEKVVQGNEKTEIIVPDIEKPVGEHTLKVKALDVRGNEVLQEAKFENNEGKDIKEPEVTIQIKNGLIEIKAVDDQEMKDLEYRWDEEDPKTVLAETGQDKKEIKVSIKPKEGDGVLKIVARDKTENVKKETKEIKGVKPPEIKAELTVDKSAIELTITHPVGIKIIEYVLNGQTYSKEFREDETNNKNVKIKQDLAIGTNKFTIKAKSVEGIESESLGTTIERPNIPTQPQIPQVTPGGIPTIPSQGQPTTPNVVNVPRTQPSI